MNVKIIIIPCLLIFWLLGCGDNTSSNTEPVQVIDNPLHYFGFAAIDCSFDDPTDTETKTNYVDEVSSFTNIGQMCVFEPNEVMGERLSNFRQSGIKAMLHIESILFEHNNDPSTGSGTKISLRGDANIRWSTFVELNKAVLTAQDIAAIYVVDEPVWNGLSYAEFSAALHIVKSTFPNIPTMMIEAYPVIDQVMVTDELDWLGFDRYDTVDPENDQAWKSDFSVVEAALTNSEQKIIIVASTQWLPYYLDAEIKPEDMEKVIKSYYHVAKSHTNVIALIGYLWPSGLDDPQQIGARNLPENVKQSLENIGKNIILH